MITIVSFWLLVFLYAYRIRIIRQLPFAFNVWAALLICALGFLEVLLLQRGGHIFFMPDEFWYLQECQRPFSDILNEHHRYLGYMLFSRITYLTAGEWALRIHSIPFAILMSLILYDATRNKNTLWLFPVFFGYFFFLATLNLRDSMMICAMLFFALKVSRSSVRWTVLWSCCAILFFSVMRPEFSILWFFLLVWMLIDRLFLGKRVFLTFIVPATTAVFIYVFFSDSVTAVANYFYPGRMAEYMLERSEELGRLPFLNENASALVRQLITPLPTSKLEKLLTYGPAENLVLKELFRIILMTSFFFMTIMTIWKFKEAYQLLKKSSFLRVLFAISVMTLILYAAYGSGGGGSSRNKVYPFIFVYVMFNSLFTFRSAEIHVSDGLLTKQPKQTP